MSAGNAKYQAAVRAQRAAAMVDRGVPNPRRITMALDAGGHEGPEVDIACGGLEPMVDEWEAGTRIPTPDQLHALADLTGYPVEFFYRTDPALIVGFICTRSGRGRGCTLVDQRPAAPMTPILPETLF